MDEGAFAAGRHFDGGTHKLLGHLDGKLLDGFAALSVDGFVQHLGLADLEFEAFAAHGFDEHRKVQHTAAEYHEGIGVQARFHAQGQVLFQLAVQAVLDVAGRDVFAVFPEEGGIVDGKEHAHRGFVHGDGRQGLRVFEVGDGVANLESFDAHHGADVTALDIVYIGLAQAVEDHELLDFGFLNDVVALAQAHLLARVEASAGNLSHGDPAHVRGVFQRGNEHLGRAFLHGRGGNHLQDGIQQGCDVAGGFLPVAAHPALFGAAENGGEVELVLVRVQGEHQVEDFFLHFVGTAVGFIDLIDDHDGFLAQFKRFLQDEARLRHAAFEGVYQQEHAVGHIQDPFHLASEIAVARSVDDVDFHALIDDGNVLRQDGDAPFAFEVVVVEDELSEVFGLADQIGLVNHPVHKGGLAVVDVRDERYVPDFLHKNV